MRHCVQIERGAIHSADAAALIAALNAELTLRYPEEGANHFRLDQNEVDEGRGAFFIAYVDGRAVGCGAIRKLDTDRAEIKRMYVDPVMRGRGIARLVLAELEGEARRLGVQRVVLETGDRQAEAMAVYLRAGYARIPPFGEYVDSPVSVCMQKVLVP